MSIRTDSGVCRYCGSVVQLALLKKLEEADEEEVDGYVCPDCDEEGVPPDTKGVR